MDEVVIGDSLEKIRGEITKIEKKKEYERDLEALIKQNQRSDRLKILKDLQDNLLFK